jgi:hypothetical protein
MVDRDGGQHDPKDMICSKFQGKKGQNHVNTLVAVEHLQEFLKSTCHRAKTGTAAPLPRARRLPAFPSLARAKKRIGPLLLVRVKGIATPPFFSSTQT